MTIIVQVSDPHFGTERPTVVEALVQLLKDLNPAVLLLTGDITQRATGKQFRAARAFVNRLNIANLISIPGNHDIPLFNLAARLFSPYSHYTRAFGSNVEQGYENDDVLILALNTTRWYRHKDGEISPEHIEYVARRCDRVGRNKYRMVVLHHPVAVTEEYDRNNIVHGSARAIERWAAAGVDLVIGGHIHLPFVIALHEQYPTLPKSLWAVQAGTAVSHRVRPNTTNSINVLRTGIREGVMQVPSDLVLRHCQVERWDFNGRSQRFEMVNAHSLAVRPP